MTEAPPLHLLEVGIAAPPETFLRRKLAGLAQRGLKVTVYATPSARAGDRNLAGAKVIHAPLWEEPAARMAWGLLLAVLRLAVRHPCALGATVRAARAPIDGGGAGGLSTFARRLRSYLPLAAVTPDVVHFEWNSAAIHYLPMADVWSCPTVVSCHGTEVNVRPHAPGADTYRRLLRASFARVSAVHCVSAAIAREALALGMDPRRAFLVRSAVDSDAFSPPDEKGRRVGPSQPLRVITVGDFRWMKTQEYAVRTVALLARDGLPVTLEIVGSDPQDGVPEDSDRERVELAIADMELADRVRLSGTLPPEAVRDRLREADVLLHLSLTEGLPTVVLEAMSCGLPVVTSDCGGVREAVADGVEGFVVPLRGVADAARALRTLYRDEPQRRRMGAAARSRVLADFRLDGQLDQFIAMYQAVRADSAPSGWAPSAQPETSRSPTRAEPIQLRVLSVAPLAWTQGLDDAMQAVSLVRGRGIDCCQRILGTGPYHGALWFSRRQLGLEAQVEFDDPDEAWPRQLEWADVLLDASFCNPPLTAIAAADESGVDVITTAEAARELTDGRARIVPPRDPAAIAGALADLFRRVSAHPRGLSSVAETAPRTERRAARG